jgi:hypothetical protein
MDNLSIYEAVRQPPQNALKKIQGGRLSGKTDINPMWRIKTLTEQFGVCGIGWYYTINKQWLEEGANGEVAAFCNISLYVKIGDEWSKPIEGTGGSAFTAKEKSGLRSDDDCYKKALTDAISVSCKALGIAADVYWNEDTTKYSVNQSPPPTNVDMITSEKIMSNPPSVHEDPLITLNNLINKYNKISNKTIPIDNLCARYGVKTISELSADNIKNAIDGMQEALSKLART